MIFEVSQNNNSDINRFIGTWELESFPGSDPNDTTTYIFYENGTFLSTFIDYDGETHTGWGDYSVENGIICMKTHPHGAITDNESYCYDYEFSNGDTRVTLSASELPTVTLIKIQ
jgi:hypothetical protein